jgi:hypothetical protein
MQSDSPGFSEPIFKPIEAESIDKVTASVHRDRVAEVKAVVSDWRIAIV